LVRTANMLITCCGRTPVDNPIRTLSINWRNSNNQYILIVLCQEQNISIAHVASLGKNALKEQPLRSKCKTSYPCSKVGMVSTLILCC